MATFGNNNPAFLKSFYECKKCNFFTSKKSHYSEHILTLKHQKGLLGDLPRKSLSSERMRSALAKSTTRETPF